MTRLDMLKQKREDIVRQRDNAFAVHQQAIGALTLIDHLIDLEQKEPQEMSLGDLASSLGADSAEIVEVKTSQP